MMMYFRKHIQSDKSGFTLLEILISITVLMFLMLGVYFITDNSTTGKDRTVSEDRSKVQIEAAMNRIEQDFSRIYNPLFYKAKQLSEEELLQKNSTNKSSTPPQDPPFEVNERFPVVTKDNQPVPAIINEDKTDLTFMSFVHQRKVQNAKESHFVWIKYIIRNTEITDRMSIPQAALAKKAPLELIRYYTPADVYSTEFEFDNFKPSILLRFIKEFKFEFWDDEKLKFQDRIRELSNKHILRAIKVSFTVMDENEVEYKFVRIFKSIWPYFDPKVDEEAIKNTGKNVNNNNNNNNSSGGNSSGSGSSGSGGSNN